MFRLFRLFPLFDYGADDLMARHKRQLGLRQFSVDHMQVGSTNGTSLYSNQDLFNTGLGDRQFLLAERLQALKVVCPGGSVVCGGMHMSDIPSFPYSLLWHERTICSIANLSRRDGEEFLALAPQVPVRTEVQTYSLEEANEVLDRLRSGRIRGAAVLMT
jgi:hypothetical protein